MRKTSIPRWFMRRRGCVTAGVRRSDSAVTSRWWNCSASWRSIRKRFRNRRNRAGGARGFANRPGLVADGAALHRGGGRCRGDRVGHRHDSRLEKSGAIGAGARMAQLPPQSPGDAPPAEPAANRVKLVQVDFAAVAPVFDPEKFIAMNAPNEPASPSRLPRQYHPRRNRPHRSPDNRRSPRWSNAARIFWPTAISLRRGFCSNGQPRRGVRRAHWRSVRPSIPR